MKNKLIKKHQQGDPIEYSRNTNNMFINQRQAIHDAAEKYYKEHPEDRDKTRVGEFAFRPVRYAEGVDPYIDTFTGKPILNGQNILTRNGKVVTAKSQDWLDWLAETGQTLPGSNLPELYIEYNKDTKDTRRHTGQTWDEMNAAVENAPIATTQEWEQQAQNNFGANDIILQNIKKRAADRRAHELTPGVGSLALLGTVGSLAAWNPLAFITSLGAAKIGEETLDFPFQQQGYQSFGDWWLGPDASDTAKEVVNLGTWLGGGAGYSTAKMYQAAAKNLSKRLGTEWAAKSLSAMYPEYNSYPQLVLDVPAVEISSTPLRSSKLPGVFFAKAGEINEGSAAGASRRPILRKNMHEFSDAEWDAAYEAALAKGNKQEMWRLLTLRFQQKAQEYIANGGGDPKILYRGNYREPIQSFRDNVWLTSDPKYALNFTADRTGGWFPIFDEKKVKPYFVKGSSEQLLPESVIKDLPRDLLMRDWTWTDIANDLVFGVPDRVRTYSSTLDQLINDAINNGATSQEIMQQFKRDPLINKAYNLGKADVLIGHDTPVRPTGIYKHWIPSSGIEYNVKNPNYVKLAKLLTYDDNGNMIPLSQRFNFWRNDRRYGWLIPLLPFLYGNKKDQAE